MGSAMGWCSRFKRPQIRFLFKENGLIFEADPINGQKTGFFLDQRENRLSVQKLSKGKSVLNVFAYTGGFSVYAARGGAKEVVSVDVSQHALEAAVRNMEHNKLTNIRHETIAEDAFDVLARMKSQKRLFDMVIIDPPMFAQSEKQIIAALAAYHKLTRLGLGVLKKSGTLVQASCSSRVDAETFFDSVNKTAKDMGRRLTEIERTGHPFDHPVGFNEGAYLKCLFALAS